MDSLFLFVHPVSIANLDPGDSAIAAETHDRANLSETRGDRLGSCRKISKKVIII
ncbi:hypothetical protein JJD41_06950 [Oxynema sp. CENA135]|uniref:hypothetical protein n=1 Tax=Oxynema sp. CENA135 TaxID=984206 RepID=UPI00190B8495|nr:hypothetical protein [Oxynema sp. CENA135]MBK4729605.1 hypothetical protein [Oxynema sp. CENA135]